MSALLATSEYCNIITKQYIILLNIEGKTQVRFLRNVKVANWKQSPHGWSAVPFQLTYLNSAKVGMLKH